MSFYVRLMRRDDVDQVTEIDREAFPTVWPPVNYSRELQNQLAHYIVVCDVNKTFNKSGIELLSGWDTTRLVSRVRWLLKHFHFFSNETHPSTNEYIIGFTGFWIISDEAHITSIAVRESYRRRGVGELLLVSTIDMVPKLNACSITLEVRTSNAAAQHLYCKYGFTRTGLRSGYYTDNREDAVLMAVEDIKSNSYQMRFQLLKQAYSERQGISLCQVIT